MKNIVKMTTPRGNSLLGLLAVFLAGTAALTMVSGCQSDSAGFSAPPLASKGASRLTPTAPAPGVSNSATANPATPAPAAYILREGDILKISFPGSPNLNAIQQIRTDGRITLPLIGEVNAAGLTPDQLQKKLMELYAPQLSTKEVTVDVQSSSFPVYVTGAVLRPGKISSDHPITALEAIMEVGGFAYPKANLKAVVVIRQEGNQTKRYKLNLKKIMNGGSGAPFYMKPNDIIYVPERFNWF